MRRDGSPSRLPAALDAGRRELLLYLISGITYVAIGVAFPEFLFAWVVAVAFLLFTVVALPAIFTRLRQ